MANGNFININYVTIYGLIDYENNIKYIGVTRRVPSYRFNNHMYEARHFPTKNNRTKWISSIDYKVKQIILDEVPEAEWEFWEKYWICQMKQWGFELVNSNNGGGGLLKRSEEFSRWLSNRNMGNTYREGKQHSEKSKKLMSEKAKGRTSPNKGNELSKEWRDKISKSNKGRVSPRKGVKVSEETLEKKMVKVTQLTLDNKIIKQWGSITEAGNSLGINIGHITNVCRGKRKTTGGYKWEYNG
jgi:hypothetical protein